MFPQTDAGGSGGGVGWCILRARQLWERDYRCTAQINGSPREADFQSIIMKDFQTINWKKNGAETLERELSSVPEESSPGLELPLDSTTPHIPSSHQCGQARQASGL